MKITPSALHFVRRSTGFGLMAIFCGHLFAAEPQDRGEKLRRFEADRQACRSGKSGQDFATCMKEAEAVLADRGKSSPAASTAQLQSDAVARCGVFTGDEHTACLARIQGNGTVSGSVAGGGILRETVTTEIVPADAQTPASSDTKK